MERIEDLFLQRLEERAAKWVEEEIARRMIHIKESLQEQVNISLSEIGLTRAGNHFMKAVAFAEENLRMDLEFDAQTWIDEELGKRKNAIEQNGK